MMDFAVWFAQRIAIIWAVAAIASPLFLGWASILRRKTLAEVEKLKAEADAEAQLAEEQDRTSEPGLVTDWRSLQADRANEKRPKLFYQFQISSQRQILFLTVIAAFLAATTNIYGEDFTTLPSFQELPLRPLLQNFILLLPWFITMVLGRWFYYPIFQELGQIRWSRSEYRSFVVWDSLGLLLFCTALCSFSFLMPDIMAVAATLALGITGQVFCKSQAAGQVEEAPLPLLPGELRDRIQDIGKSAGVTITKINILPKMRSAMANAFAHPDGSVSLTDYFVLNSRRQEVDAVIAHEISHVKYNHSRWLLGMWLLHLAILAWSFWQSQTWLTFLTSFSLIYLPRRFSRRFEYAADNLAGQLTQQPQEMIAALTRIEQLNPLRQPGNVETTHPSMLKRFEAIAKAHSLPDETVRQQLLQAQTPVEPADVYNIPMGREDRLFPAVQRQKAQQRQLFLILAGSVVPLVAIAAWLPQISAPSLRLVLQIIGLILVTLWVIFLDHQSTLRLPKVPAQQLQSWQAEQANDSVIVSLSPEQQPQSYNGCWYWDLGLLNLKNGQLHYRGGQTKFVLSPGQVTGIHLGPGAPSLFRQPSLYISWCNQEDQSHGQLRLRLYGAASTTVLRQMTRDWRDRLEAWRQTSPTDSHEARPELERPSLNRDSFITALGTRSQGLKLLFNLVSFWLLGALLALMLVGMMALPVQSWIYAALGPLVAVLYTAVCHGCQPQAKAMQRTTLQPQS